MVFFREGWCEVDVVEIHNQCRRQGEIANHLIFQGDTNRDIPARVVTVDSFRTGPAVEVRVEQADSRERYQVDPIIEAKVIASDGGNGDLEEITHWADLHHRSDRKVPIDEVVGVERQGEHRAVDRSRCEAQIATEPPAVFIGLNYRCGREHTYGQDGQQTGGTGPS
jgi:hypothetical protein